MTAPVVTPADAATRNRVAAEARRWIGTPFHHQASLCGQGADCLGLVRGIWRRVIGPEPADMPAYTPDWSDLSGAQALALALGKHFAPVDRWNAVSGDVVLFRMRPRGAAKHVGVLSGEGRFIHTYSGHSVVETGFSPAWERRAAGFFRFPARSD